MPKFPAPKKFEDKYQEREYQKGRLVLAFRIFAKLGFDEGVAGHITLRVSSRSESKSGDGWESSGGQMEGFGGVKIRKASTDESMSRIRLNQRAFGLIPLVSRGHF
jgi:ribulose-5-phosphate 4-epimerase/fuculose-1-phosphate aldolase